MKRMINAWRYRCPRCRRGKLFSEPFDLGKPLAMPVSCAICGQSFEPEPGYYYGAMFISYIMSCFLLLPLALGLSLFTAMTVNQTMVLVILLGALLYIRILRLSRALWINIMVPYDQRHNTPQS